MEFHAFNVQALMIMRTQASQLRPWRLPSQNTFGLLTGGRYVHCPLPPVRAVMLKRGQSSWTDRDPPGYKHLLALFGKSPGNKQRQRPGRTPAPNPSNDNHPETAQGDLIPRTTLSVPGIPMPQGHRIVHPIPQPLSHRSEAFR